MERHCVSSSTNPIKAIITSYGGFIYANERITLKGLAERIRKKTNYGEDADYISTLNGTIERNDKAIEIKLI